VPIVLSMLVCPSVVGLFDRRFLIKFLCGLLLLPELLLEGLLLRSKLPFLGLLLRVRVEPVFLGLLLLLEILFGGLNLDLAFSISLFILSSIKYTSRVKQFSRSIGKGLGLVL